MRTYLNVVGDLQKRWMRHHQRGDCVFKRQVETSTRAVAVARNTDLSDAVLPERGQHFADTWLGVVNAVAGEPPADIES